MAYKSCQFAKIETFNYNTFRVQRRPMKRLYITDLDGTLLNNDGELSDYSRSAIEFLVKSGVNFSVASARSVQSIRRILEGLPLSIPIVAFNGAYISNFETGKHHVVNKIDNFEMYELLTSYGVLVSLHKDGEDALFHSGKLSKGTLKYIDDREYELDVKVRPIKFIPNDTDVMAFTVINTKERIETLQKALNGYENIIVDAWEDMYYKPWYWLSIHSTKATKANGIQSLRSLLEIDIDELVTFGDNTNDIEMFKHSDISIAVENAVPELKLHAKEIIEKNTENSVVNKICKMEGIYFDTKQERFFTIEENQKDIF